MRDDSILDRLSDSDSADEAVHSFFYHGSIEKFDGNPEVGGDGVFWCADNPAVAQCYIPAAGSEAILSVPGFELAQKVRPSKYTDWYGLVKAMGFESPDVEWGQDGRAKSWVIPKSYPTYGNVCDWLESSLGYVNQSSLVRDRHYRVKTSYQDDNVSIYLPSSYMAPGRLFVVDGLRDLRLLDLATGREGDLSDPDYLKLDIFQRAADAGYHGIVIPDFVQSRSHGNVGHVSWGVFRSALHLITHSVIPAVRFDWLENERCSQSVTPEFEAAWHAHRYNAAGLTSRL